jgi:cyanobactin maturation PatA/PatG family protease
METSDQNSTNAVDTDRAKVTGNAETQPIGAEQLSQSTRLYRSLLEGFPNYGAIRSAALIGPSASKNGSVTPSDCACGGGTASLVYALGQIGYDFGTEARRDSLVQQGIRDPHDSRQLSAHLKANAFQATAVVWTLTQDATPIYAIRPAGPFAAETYERLREFLNAAQEEGVERVSIPGVVSGTETLTNGQVVPVIYPELRGMYSWSTKALLGAVLGKAPAESAKGQERAAYEQKQAGVRNFLDRVYDEMRNLGLTSQERALNYAATNAFQVQQVYQTAIEEQTQLDTIQTEKSPVCRPGADCWDVKLTFFNPTRRFEQARKVYRFTVDVTDVVPVTVGTMRQWHVY